MAKAVQQFEKSSWEVQWHNISLTQPLEIKRIAASPFKNKKIKYFRTIEVSNLRFKIFSPCSNFFILKSSL